MALKRFLRMEGILLVEPYWFIQCYREMNFYGIFGEEV